MGGVCLHFPQYSSATILLTLTVVVRDLRSFEIRFDFESNFRFWIRFVVMIRFENRPHRQSSFVKKRLAVVKFAFKVEFGSKIIVQRHSLTRFRTELK